MYILRDGFRNIIKSKDGKTIVFLRLDDADFIGGCFGKKIEIESVSFLPSNSVICELKGLINHE